MHESFIIKTLILLVGLYTFINLSSCIAQRWTRVITNFWTRIQPDPPTSDPRPDTTTQIVYSVSQKIPPAVV